MKWEISLRGRLLKPLAVEYQKIDGQANTVLIDKTNQVPMIVFFPNKTDARYWREFIHAIEISKDPAWREWTWKIEIEKETKSRSLEQNRLMWALLHIMSVVVYQEGGHEDELYEDMLDLYAPKKVSKLTGKARNVTSSKLSVGEMCRLIEGIFNQLASLGVHDLKMANDIEHFWRGWYAKRFDGREDPLLDDYATLEDYRTRINYCEACLRYLGEYGSPEYTGQLAHIVSRGASGMDDLWNRLHLCHECHVPDQHQHGWTEFVAKYPHLMGKVNAANERAGKKQVEMIENVFGDKEEKDG